MSNPFGVMVDERDHVAVPGIAVAINIDGENVTITDGVTNLDHPTPVGRRTLFPIGSLTKTFVATATLTLEEQGVLSTTDPVRAHLPECASDFGDVTIDHLLTHRGGWEGDWALYHAPASRDSGALRMLARDVANVPRVAPPGEVFSYDNFGWCVLGAVLESATGQNFDQVIESIVLKPLGLRDTFFGPDKAVTRPTVAGHRFDPSTGTTRVSIEDEPWADQWPCRRALWPSGGLVSTIQDLSKWADLHAGLVTDGPLSQGRRQAMGEPHARSGGQGSSVGYGWHLLPTSRTVLTHSGVVQCCNASLVVVPDRSASLVVLGNSPAAADTTADIQRSFFDRLDIHMVEERPVDELEDLREGHYATTDRTIEVRFEGSETVVVNVNDSGPTWSDENQWHMRSIGAGRLAAIDDPTVRMEYGIASDDRSWVRHRGRVHPLVAETGQ